MQRDSDAHACCQFPTLNQPHQEEDDIDYHEVDNTLVAEDADEVIEDDGDAPKGLDEESDEDKQVKIEIQNESTAHFDGQRDIVSCIPQRPVLRSIVTLDGHKDSIISVSFSQPWQPRSALVQVSSSLPGSCLP